MARKFDVVTDGDNAQRVRSAGDRLTVVTLAKNNPAEVWRTLRSVWMQGQANIEGLVVDGSDPDIADQIREFAKRFGARYVWIPAEGIYPAMHHSLWMLAPDSYVWWLNSSDWLAGPHAIANARRELAKAKASSGSAWIVGQLLRTRGGRYELHKLDSKPERFVHQLMSGNVGFAHPSTIFPVGMLQEIKPFESGLRIAGDFAAAIAFGHRYGPPAIGQHVLSVHEVNGLTFRHPFLSFWEKSLVRWRFGNWKIRLREPFAFVAFGLSSTVARFLVGPIRGALEVSDLLSLPGVEHFCQSEDFSRWPRCCQEALDAGFPVRSAPTPLHQ